MANNPILHNDPLGDTAKPGFQAARVNAAHSYLKTNAAKHSSGKGDDCITCHNKAMKILTNNPSLKTGSKADLTRTKMQQQGYAGATKTFGFNDANGKPAKAAPDAASLSQSVGTAAVNGAKDIAYGESAAYGLSIMGGYHSMTLTVTKTGGPSETIPNTGIKTADFTSFTITLSDQGSFRGTMGHGNLNIKSAEALDTYLTGYVQSQSSQKTKDESFYPATIQLHQIINNE